MFAAAIPTVISSNFSKSASFIFALPNTNDDPVIVPVVVKLSFPKLIAPLESVIDPSAIVISPIVEPVAALNVPPITAFFATDKPPSVCKDPSVVEVASVVSSITTLPDVVKLNKVPTSVICVCDESTLKVLPDLVKPVLTVINPAPLNCVNANELPIVKSPSDDNTHPVSAFTLPSSTNVKSPPLISESLFISIALVGVPLVTT